MASFKTSLNRRRLIQTGTTAIGASALTGPAALAGANPAAHQHHRLAAQDVTSVRALMWSNGPIIDGNFENRVKAFNQEHEGSINVDLQFLPWDQYWQRLQLAYASGDSYDVYFWDTQAYGHYQRDLLLNLQPLVDESGYLKPDEYPMELFEPWRLDGENLYAIPENFQTLALYYNTELFDAEGLEHPDETWDYDRVVEAALAMTKRDGNRVSQWGMSLGTLGIWWGMQTISWAKGDAFFDNIVEPTKFQFSNPANVETLDFVRSLVHDHQVAPSPSVNEQNPDVSGFASGRVGLVIDGSWSLSTYAELPFGWGVAPIPMVEGNRVVPYWMGGWVIAQESEVAEAAFEWARWSASDYQDEMAAEHDWIPVLTSARESEAATEGMPEGYGAVIDSLENARLGDVYSSNTQQIWVEVFEPRMAELLNQNRPAQEVAEEMDQQANALLNS